MNAFSDTPARIDQKELYCCVKIARGEHTQAYIYDLSDNNLKFTSFNLLIFVFSMFAQ